MDAMPEEDTKLVDELHEAFISDKGPGCHLLVGAGASVASGLPTWTELGERLLSLFFREVALKNGDLELQTEDVREAGNIYMERFGREATVDVVRQQLEELGADRARYIQLLKKALYGGSPKDVSGLHLEAAAWVAAARSARYRKVFTFNFDDFLEEAITRLFGNKPVSIYDRRSEQGAEWDLTKSGLPKVIHLHGYLPSGQEDKAHGRLILSESDYYEMQGDPWGWSARHLHDLFQEEEGAVLLAGLSMTDPRLRMFLLDRLNQQRSEGQELRPKVYVMLDSPAPSSGKTLVERVARQLVQSSERKFWQEWEVNALLVRRGLAPFYFRRIRLGSKGRQWVEEGRKFLHHAPKSIYRSLYGATTQRHLQGELRKACLFLRRVFPVGTDELLQLGGFVPTPQPLVDKEDALAGCLSMAFRYKELPLLYAHLAPGEGQSPDILDEQTAAQLRMDVSKLDALPSAAGRSFAWGCVVEATRDELGRSSGLDESLEGVWQSERTFASILCAPVSYMTDKKQWIPAGLMFLTSSRQTPFWQHLDATAYDELVVVLSSFFHELVVREPGLVWLPGSPLRVESETTVPSQLGLH